MMRIPSSLMRSVGAVGAVPISFDGSQPMSFEQLATNFIADQAQEQAGIDPALSGKIVGAVSDGKVSTDELRDIAGYIAGAGAAAGCVAAGLAVVAPLCAGVGKSLAGLVFSEDEPGVTPQQMVDAVAKSLSSRCPAYACQAAIIHMVEAESQPFLAAAEVVMHGSPFDLPQNTAAMAQAHAMFVERSRLRAQNMIVASQLESEASFIDRTRLFADTVINAYAPTCTIGCDPGWLEGKAEELAYEALSAERFPGNQSPEFVASFHRKQIEGEIKEKTGKAPVGVSFVVPKDYSSNSGSTPVFQNLPADGSASSGPTATSQYQYDVAGNPISNPEPAAEESSALPTVLGVVALAAAGWTGWRLYKKQPIVPKF